MRSVIKIGMEKNVWIVTSQTKPWDSAAVTALWNAIWEDFVPFMQTKTTLSTGNISIHKSRAGEIAAITIYNKLIAARELRGSRCRNRRRSE